MSATQRVTAITMSRAAARTLRCGARVRAAATLAAAATAVAVACPSAVAADAPRTSIVSSNVVGPSATFSEVSTGSDCGGRLVAGGGTRLAQGTPTVQHNGIRPYASTPSPSGVLASGDGELNPTRWLSSGGSGGGVPNDAQTLGYALCLDAGVATTVVAAASTPGPAGTFTTVQATATCPPGSRLLSGGARTTPGTVGSLKPNGSFPSDAAGHPLLSGPNPSSWTAVGLNGGGGDQGNTTHAFALCATGDALPNVAIAHAQVPGPAIASTAGQVSASCPAGSTLLGGGGFISDAFALPGSQGDHLTGSYPSDEQGTPVASGATRSWTAASHTGGVDSSALTQTDVWAICASAADAPPPQPAPGPGAAVPAATRKPALSGRARRGSTLRATRGMWTNAPIAYAHSWQRCRSDASACTTITGASGPSYRLTLADAGARIRVAETARNATGNGLAASSATTAIVAAGSVTPTQIRGRLRAALIPGGRASRASSLLARDTVLLAFQALSAGRATISWYRAAAGAGTRVLVARGTRSFPGARLATIALRLTPAGRRALRSGTPPRLKASGAFTRRGRPALHAATTFRVSR